MRVWLTEITATDRFRPVTLDAGAVHRWLTKAADGPRFLWVSPRAGHIVIQSQAPLNREALRQGVRSLYSAERPLHYPTGTRLELIGIIAPTKAESRGEGRRGKIRALPHDEQADWVHRKLSPVLTLDSPINVEPMSPSQGKKTGGHRVLHTRSSFHTYGTIKDPDKLATLLTQGVGRGKRYGTGLILTKEVTI